MKSPISPSETKKLINEVISKLRLQLKQLAEKLGVSPEIVSRWYNGRTPLSLRNFQKIKNLLEQPGTEQGHAMTHERGNDMLAEMVIKLVERQSKLENEMRTIKEQLNTDKSASGKKDQGAGGGEKKRIGL